MNQITAQSRSADELLARLDSRHSIPSRLLAEPGPDDATLLRMLRSAVRVPDHGRRVPFRLLRIAGDARRVLGERLVARARERDPAVATAVLAKDRQRFLHAPVVIAVIAKLGPDEKIPEQERLLSAGCVCFALLQAAGALGYGAQWLTGWAAYDPVITTQLGVAAEERIIGFVHIGTASCEPPDHARPDPADLLTDWPAA